MPSNIERRENDIERCELPRAPPAPPPTEDQLFTDWSSIDSPRERTPLHSASARNIVPNTNHGDRRAYDDQKPPGRRMYQDRSERPLNRGNSHDRGYSRRRISKNARGRASDGNGRPPHDGGHPDDGGHPGNG